MYNSTLNGSTLLIVTDEVLLASNCATNKGIVSTRRINLTRGHESHNLEWKRADWCHTLNTKQNKKSSKLERLMLTS